MANVLATDFVSRPNLFTMTDMLTHPHCSIRPMKVASSFSSDVNRSRVLDSGLKEPNLTWLDGKSAARRTVLLDGMAEDANDSLSRESTWLRFSMKMSVGFAFGAEAA